MAANNLRGSYFVTGTDTGVGKTVVATGLLAAAGARGLATVGLKPVAAGCELRGAQQRLVNDDALALQRAATIELDYASVNPVALREPIAPHIAAQSDHVEIRAEALVSHCRKIHRAYKPEIMIIEGAGGWNVPINDSETLADFCHALSLPIILVVGMRLGCLNHALLTAESIRHRDLSLAGWVANVIDDDMSALDTNVSALQNRLDAPLLGAVPRLGATLAGGEAARCLDTAPLTRWM